MSPLSLIRQTLRGVQLKHLASISRLNAGERILYVSRPTGLNLNQFRGTINDQTAQHRANIMPQEDKGTIKTRCSLKEKIKDSQRKFHVVSLPNIITSSRLLMAPAMGYFIMNNMHSHALVCCAYTAISDIADKYVAKLTKQSSPLNFVLDVIADKSVIITSCIALYNVNVLNIFFIKSIIVRDFILLGGGATIRYHGFDERPSLKQYLDFNTYPSLAFRTNTLNQVNAGLHYALIMALLSLNHLDGDPTYDNSMLLYQGLLILLSSVSIAWCLNLFLSHRFLSFIRRNK